MGVDVLTKVEKDILHLVVHMDQVGNTLENQIREKVTVVKNMFIMVNQIKDMGTVLAKDTIMDQVGNTLENQIREKVTVVESMFIMVNQIKDMDTVLVKNTVDILTKVEKDILPLDVHMDQVGNTLE